jgi:hypothetical protein
VVIFHFSDADPAGTASDYQAVVTLGDGNSVTLTSTASSNGQIVAHTGGGFDVQLSHTYAEELSGKTFSVQVTDAGGAATSASTSTFSVADASLGASSTALTAMQGIPFSNQVATFNDSNPVGTLSDFTATITWGDGSTPSAGAISQPGGVGTTFDVQGSHTYAAGGVFTVTVNIVDTGGKTAATSFTMTVASIVVLNSTAHGALTANNSANITVSGAVVVDSSASDALTIGGTAQINAGKILVVGGVSRSGTPVLNPTPITGVSPLADPLASLPVPPGGTNQGSVNLASGSLTINPGVYSQIKVSGGSLTLNPGIYVIAGGGFKISGNASVTGTGVMIYNAGSNFPSAGGTFGAIAISNTGAFSLSAASTGTYQGVVIFQSRDNTLALSVTGTDMYGVSGTVYAANALLSLSSGAQFQHAQVVVGTLSAINTVGLTQVASGTDGTGDQTGIANTLLGVDLNVYINDRSGYFTADEQARIKDAIKGLDALLVPYSVTIGEVSDPALANLVLDTGTTSACGGAAAGVLGCYDGATGEITIIQGWNWYAGADPSRIGADQYDFQTTVTHEFGHALGLGGSKNPNSPMHETLRTGTAHRVMTVQDLNIPDPPAGADPLTAAGDNQVHEAAVPLVGVGDTRGLNEPVASLRTFESPLGSLSEGAGASIIVMSQLVPGPWMSTVSRLGAAAMFAEDPFNSRPGQMEDLLRDDLFARLGSTGVAPGPETTQRHAASSWLGAQSESHKPVQARGQSGVDQSRYSVAQSVAQPATVQETGDGGWGVDWYLVGAAVGAMALSRESAEPRRTDWFFARLGVSKDTER